jgi:lipid-A-disaccharide synthase
VVHLYSPFPATNLLAKATLCITTIGANTAELASLGIPMLVVLPTGESQISTRVAWDGILGLINYNRTISRWINQYMVNQIRKRQQKLAWPNIWANREIVPELWGDINPQFLAKTTLGYLQNSAKLAQMRADLLEVSGHNQQGNAAQKIRARVIQEAQ